MSDNPILSYLQNIDWVAFSHWYLTNLDLGYLIKTLELGGTFTQEDWISTALISAHIVAIFYLLYLLYKNFREKKFRQWVEEKRSQITRRPPSESRTHLEAKVNASPALQQAYNLHRLAMYEPALDKYKEAVVSAPNEINAYLVGIKIVAEMDEPNNSFIGFLKQSIASLQENRPDIWREVARYSKEVAPNLDCWQAA